jgi:hypothetical protein
MYIVWNADCFIRLINYHNNLCFSQALKLPKLYYVTKHGKAGMIELERIKGEMRRKYSAAGNLGRSCGPPNYQCSNLAHAPPTPKKKKKQPNKEGGAESVQIRKRGKTTPMKTAYRKLILMGLSKEYIMSHNFGGSEGPGPLKKTGLTEMDQNEIKEIACKFNRFNRVCYCDMYIILSVSAPFCLQ